MTVGELIARLYDVPGDLLVAVPKSDSWNDWVKATEVKVVELYDNDHPEGQLEERGKGKMTRVLTIY